MRKGVLISAVACLVACHNYNLDGKLTAALQNSEIAAGKKYTVFVSANSIQIASGSTWTAAAGSSIGSCGSAGSQLAIADCACSYWASAAGLGTQFRAWISDSANDAICRLTGVNGTGCQVSGASQGPYYNLSGGLNGSQRKLVFNSLAEIAAGAAPASAVAYQENGNLSAATAVVTGTLTTGRVDNTGHCTDWSSGGANTYRVGDPTSTTAWTQGGTGACSASAAPLYCFEY